jgi:hypothetical protein
MLPLGLLLRGHSLARRCWRDLSACLALLLAACGPEPAARPGAAAPAQDEATDTTGGSPALAARDVTPSLPALSGLDPRDPARQRIEIRGTTQGAPSVSAPAACAGLGPELVYPLDLRAFPTPARFELGLSGGFDGSLRIERGSAEDPFIVACNADHVNGVDGAFLSVTLEPELYQVVVDGETAADAGEFALWLELLAQEERCRAAPANDRCERATPLDLGQRRQVVAGTTECATDQAQPLWECGNFGDRRGEVFYGLDLSERTETTIVHASTDVEPVGADVALYVVREVAGDCAETLQCSFDRERQGTAAELWAALPPDRYLLAVENRGAQPSNFGLMVELNGACRVDNDTCATAAEIPPLLGTQRLTAWPMCGDDSLRSTCQRSGPTPDLFYRLDLSSFPEPVLVQATSTRSGSAFESLLLMGESAGTCAGELWCGDFELLLPPAVYYLALDAFRDQQGPVELSVTLSTPAPQAAAACIGAEVAQCARQFDCCDGDRDECWLALRSCGLAPEALDCLCTADPACCGAPGTSYDCGSLLVECGTFCADFDPAVTCPL